MAWTNGFFNSNNGDRTYNAEQISRIFEGLITDGVYESVTNKLAVQPNSGMAIQINTGRGWFDGHWVNNDSEYIMTLEASDVTLNRYCAVGVRVDTSDSVRSAVPFTKYSDFATSPIKPTMTRSETLKEYCLAYVFIPAGASAISASNIEDTRGNSELCGWVTGLIEQVNTTTLWEQWNVRFNEFMTGNEAEFTSWFNSLTDYLDANTEAKLTSDLLQAQSDITTLQGRTVRASGSINGLGWISGDDGYTQTITVNGVTANNDIMVAVADADRDAYNRMGCEPVAQGANSVTFRCSAPEDLNMSVGVIIFNFT